MITHEFVFLGSSIEFYRRIRRRAEAEVRNYFSSDKKIGNRGYIDSDGYEYAIRSIPIVHKHNDNIYRLEFKVEGNKAERGTPSKIELGCLIELSPRIDGRTNIKADLHHPAFEPEFNSILLLNEQNRQSEPTTQVIAKGPRRYNSDEKRSIVERYLDIQATVKQEDYARQYHTTERNLRRWIRAYEKDKL